jgi:hypothetical protein
MKDNWTTPEVTEIPLKDILFTQGDGPDGGAVSSNYNPAAPSNGGTNVPK